VFVRHLEYGGNVLAVKKRCAVGENSMFFFIAIRLVLSSYRPDNNLLQLCCNHANTRLQENFHGVII
jgi:hypothetical protein